MNAKRFAVSAAAAALLAVAAATPSAPAVEPGGGPASGTVTCADGASLDLVSPAFVFRGEARSVEAALRAECRPLGAAPHADGPASLVGDGVACGIDGKPFAGAFVLLDPYAHVTFHGTCVIDGVEQPATFAFEGAVFGEGALVGVLVPHDDDEVDLAPAG